jgi:uncharacterized membrane protein
MGSTTETFYPADIEKNKIISGLAYLIFFLPLIVCPDSGFGRYHANQSLILFITSIAGSIILSIIPYIGWILLFPFSIAILVLAVMGLLNGLSGKAKELPLIGRFRLLK